MNAIHCNTHVSPCCTPWDVSIKGIDRQVCGSLYEWGALHWVSIINIQSVIIQENIFFQLSNKPLPHLSDINITVHPDHGKEVGKGSLAHSLVLKTHLALARVSLLLLSMRELIPSTHSEFRSPSSTIQFSMTVGASRPVLFFFSL